MIRGVISLTLPHWSMILVEALNLEFFQTKKPGLPNSITHRCEECANTFVKGINPKWIQSDCQNFISCFLIPLFMQIAYNTKISHNSIIWGMWRGYWKSSGPNQKVLQFVLREREKEKEKRGGGLWFYLNYKKLSVLISKYLPCHSPAG